MEKIGIFYHLWQGPTWETMFNDQMSILFDSGLLDAAEFVHVGINGEKEPIFKSEKIQYHFNQNPYREETDTMVSLLNFARKNNGYKLLYFHTKGLSFALRPMPPAEPFGNAIQYVYHWRKMMEYYAVFQWEDCIKILNKYDAVGPLFRLDPRPHYSGGFWWANSEYIDTLNHSLLESFNRFDKEFWIGSGSGAYANLHESGVNHYYQEYPEENWTDIPAELLGEING
jgi:hypothetical protein